MNTLREMRSGLVAGLFGLLAGTLCLQSAHAAVPLMGFSGRAWNAGVFTGGNGDVPSVSAFTSWRGKPVDSILWFASRTNWTDFDNDVTTDVINFAGIKVLALPTHPESLGWGGLDEVAAGIHNSKWQNFGAYLVANGMNNNRTVLRIGWELNGNWYVWSATSGGPHGDRRQTFKNAYINIVNSIRAGGANAVQFNWCLNKGNQGGTDPTDGWGSYPGDAYVDVIGLDNYDWFSPNFTDADWNNTKSQSPGFNDVAAFCVAHGKQMAIDEWGVIHDSNGGNDNPFFIQKIWDWLNANAGIVAYETTYDETGAPATLHHKLSPPEGTTWNPNSSALYKSLWGSAGTIQIPPAPTGLTATAGNAQVMLAWTTSSGAVSYSIYRGTTAGGESTTAIATGITSVNYTNIGLTNGTTYYYKVKAVNTAGTSGYSNEASAMPVVGASPPIADGTYTLAPANATGMRLQTTGTGDASNVNIGTPSSSTAQQWIFTNVSGNVYRLSPASATAQCLDVNGQLTTSGTNVQTWTYLSQMNQRWALTLVSGGCVLIPQHATTMRLNNTGTANGSNVNQLSANSSTAQTWAIVSIGAPAAPTGLSATAGTAQISLSWTGSSGATSYSIYRGTSAGGESTTAIATGVAGTTYTNTGLTNGTTYYYKVKAVSGGGTSGYSNEVSATPAAAATNTHTGTWAAKGNIPSNPTWIALYQQATCAQNTTYVAKIWVKGSGNFLIKTLDSGWTQIAQTTFAATSTWTEKSITFTTPNTTNPGVLFYIADAGGGGTLYVDDAFMGVNGGTNVLANAGFESGNSVWTVGSSIWSILNNP